jgi:hypothetical protein
MAVSVFVLDETFLIDYDQAKGKIRLQQSPSRYVRRVIPLGEPRMNEAQLGTVVLTPGERDLSGPMQQFLREYFAKSSTANVTLQCAGSVAPASPLRKKMARTVTALPAKPSFVSVAKVSSVALTPTQNPPMIFHSSR